MYFLERFIADMASDTGGSPFYIRNRIKDALASEKAELQDCQGKDAQGQCLEIAPFAEDEARAKMQNFADVQITFHIDEDNPLWILGIDAVNPQSPESYQFKLEAK